MKLLSVLGAVILFLCCTLSAKADCAADAKKLDADAQLLQREGGYIRAIDPLLAAARKYEECRTTVPMRSRPWIDDTVGEGFDTIGLSVDYLDAMNKTQARDWEAATNKLLSDLCRVKTSLDTNQERHAEILRWLYNSPIAQEYPDLPTISDCFRPTSTPTAGVGADTLPTF